MKLLLSVGMSPFPILGVLGGIFHFFLNFNRILRANSEDPDQTPHYAVSDLGLQCFPMSSHFFFFFWLSSSAGLV